MSPKIFDRYFLVLGIGNSRKLRVLTDSEFRAHVAGILALAAQSPLRGFLLITDGVEVTAEDVASEAGGGVTPRIAASAMQKLKGRGVLVRDVEVGAWYVHDWHEVNPDPREDRTNAERQKRHRDKQRNGASNGTVTHGVTSEVTSRNTDEVEVEVEVPANAGRARKRATRKPVDQTVPPTSFPAERMPALLTVLATLREGWDLRGGREPMERGVALGIMRNPDVDHENVARKLVHWLTAGNGQYGKCDDIASRFGNWVANEPPASKSSNVVQMRDQRRQTAGDMIRALDEAQAAEQLGGVA